MKSGRSRIVVLGKEGQSGTYLLRIRLRRDESICFGRFGKGKPVFLPAGEYAYVGSAMGEKGASCLAGRLIRHATRTRGKRPHGIREELVECLRAAGLMRGNPAVGEKKKHWHIDYLLDLETARIEQVILVRSSRRLESALARLLEEDPHVRVIEKRLGASDAAGSTHLLRVEAGEAWWTKLTSRWRRIAE